MFCNYCGAPNPDVASFCNRCGKKIAAVPSISPIQAQPIAYATEASALTAPSAPIPTMPTTAARQETHAAIGGTLTPAGRIEFTNGLNAEVRRQVEDKCFPAAIAAWIVSLIAVGGFAISEFGQGWGVGIGLVMAFVVAGMVFKLLKGFLEDKYLRPIADLSDEMFVNRYNESKADRRAAHTRNAISWAVIAIIAVIIIVAYMAAHRQ
jgi:hypothetical protein